MFKYDSMILLFIYVEKIISSKIKVNFFSIYWRSYKTTKGFLSIINFFFKKN